MQLRGRSCRDSMLSGLIYKRYGCVGQLNERVSITIDIRANTCIGGEHRLLCSGSAEQCQAAIDFYESKQC